MSRVRRARKKRRDRLLQVFTAGGTPKLDHTGNGGKAEDGPSKQKNKNRKRREKKRGPHTNDAESPDGQPKFSTGNGRADPVDSVPIKEEDAENLEHLVRRRMAEILGKAGVAQVTVKMVEGGVEKTVELKRDYSLVDATGDAGHDEDICPKATKRRKLGEEVSGKERILEELEDSKYSLSPTMPPATQPEATRSDCLVPVSSLTLDAVQETQLSQLETTISTIHKQPVPTNVEISDSQSSHNSLPDPINYRYLIEPKDEICVADVLTNDDPTSHDVRPSPILGGRCPASSDPVSELFPSTTEKTSFSTVVPSQEYDSSIHLSHSQTSQLPTPGPESVVSDAPSPPRARRDPYDLDFFTPPSRKLASKIRPVGSSQCRDGSQDSCLPRLALKTPPTISAEVKGASVVTEEELATIFSDGDIDFDEFIDPPAKGPAETPTLALRKLVFKTPKRNVAEYLTDENSLAGLMSTPLKDYGKEMPFIKNTPKPGLVSQRRGATKTPPTQRKASTSATALRRSSTRQNILPEAYRTPVRASPPNPDPGPDSSPVLPPLPRPEQEFTRGGCTSSAPLSQPTADIRSACSAAAAAAVKPQTRPAKTSARPPSSAKLVKAAAEGTPVTATVTRTCTPVPAPKPWLATQRSQGSSARASPTTATPTAVALPSSQLSVTNGAVKQTPVPLPSYVTRLSKSK